MIRLLFSYFVLFSTIELYIPEPEAPQLVYIEQPWLWGTSLLMNGNPRIEKCRYELILV